MKYLSKDTLKRILDTTKYFHFINLFKRLALYIVHTNFLVIIDSNSFYNSNTNIFDDIDINMLFGIQCTLANKKQQNYFEKTKVQTGSTFINKKFELS